MENVGSPYYTSAQVLRNSFRPKWKWWLAGGAIIWLASSTCTVAIMPSFINWIMRQEDGPLVCNMVIFTAALSCITLGLFSLLPGFLGWRDHHPALYAFRTSEEGKRLLEEGDRLHDQFMRLYRLKEAQALVNTTYGKIAKSATTVSVLSPERREPQAFVEELNSAITRDWDEYRARARDLHRRQETVLTPLWEATQTIPWIPKPGPC